MDRNVQPMRAQSAGYRSLSARRAWIEMLLRCDYTRKGIVALRKESVDRNRWPAIWLHLRTVALRKESVDRNCGTHQFNCYRSNVALRKESVDRNDIPLQAGYYSSKSLSARRAWIEILLMVGMMQLLAVALRKESVDRNDGRRYDF